MTTACPPGGETGYVACSHIEVPVAGSEPLEESFRRRLGAVDQWPGFLGLSLLRHRRRPGRYVMITQWATRDDFLSYMRSEDHRRSHARIPDGPDGPRAAGFDDYDLVAT